jgi:surface antigen
MKRGNIWFMRISAFILSMATIAALSGAGMPAYAGDDALLGTGIGAALGGLFGSQFGRGPGQFMSTTLGIAAGGAIGNSIGHDLDAESSRYYPSVGYSPPTESTPFIYYSYAPNYVAPPAPPPTYVDPDEGTYCRPYSQEIRIDGRLQESYGTACLQPDGTWRIVP